MYVQHESIRLAILKYLSDYKSRIHSLNNSVLVLYTGKYIYISYDNVEFVHTYNAKNLKNKNPNLDSSFSI